MPKNKHSNNAVSQNQRRSSDSTARNSAVVILILAILFFLLGLWFLAKATGFNLFDWLRSPNTYRAPGITSTRSGSAPLRTTGSSNDLNLNAKTDNGLDINAGINQGQIYVSPAANPNPQGGAGAQVNLNNGKVIDTHSLAQ